MNLKKKLIVLLAAGIMAFSSMPFALATTPEPAGNQEEQQAQMDNSITANAAIAANEAAAQQSVETAREKKYLSRGAAIFWFVFIGVLNGAFSFWVGNRFYRLAKKDNHTSSEIRALRRDIEDKFVKNVGGFAEQDVTVENTNENLSMEEGIKLVSRRPSMRELTPEEEERFKRWALAQTRPKTERTRSASSVRSSVRDELDDDLDDVKKIHRKNYQPKRSRMELSDVEEDDDDDLSDLGDTRLVKLGRNDGKGENAVKSKAKEILGDIFPFKED